MYTDTKWLLMSSGIEQESNIELYDSENVGIDAPIYTKDTYEDSFDIDDYESIQDSSLEEDTY